jgi:hypothetical protein
MSKPRSFSPSALVLASIAILAACSSDAPTDPPTASLNLTATAPTIYVRNSVSLCIPFSGGMTRPCGAGRFVGISNTGGGTLNWTTTKSGAWLKRSPRSGTAPSTMRIWADSTGLPVGDYTGWIKVWATGATNTPQTIAVHFSRR